MQKFQDIRERGQEGRWKSRQTVWGFVQSNMIMLRSVLPFLFPQDFSPVCFRGLHTSLGLGHVLTNEQRTRIVPDACSAPHASRSHISSQLIFTVTL